MHCGAQCELREVVLKDKPAHMLDASNKGTVPVLLVPGENTNTDKADAAISCISTSYHVIDESIDIMQWAVSENPDRDRQNANEWLTTESMTTVETNSLIEQNDFEFKELLDKYKYSDRHPEHPQAYYLEQAMPFLEKLESALSNYQYLGGSQFRFTDAAILPFIRQFSMVQPKQFNALALPKLQQWVVQGLESDLFISVMHKMPQWQENSDEELVVFGKR